MKHLRYLISIGIMAVLITSCQTQPPTENSALESPTAAVIPAEDEKSPTNEPKQEQISFLISPENCGLSNGPLPTLSNPELTSIRSVENSLGGGVVQSKEFTMELLLYCDPAFNSDADQPYFSDIDGLAVYHNWKYDASYDSGLINVFFGIDPDIQLQSGEGPTTHQGHVSQGQSTGIVFPADASYDFSTPTPLRFIYIIRTQSGQLSGAVLQFDLQKTSDGLQPTNIFVQSISDSEFTNYEEILPTVNP